jgi:hypothetical protein
MRKIVSRDCSTRLPRVSPDDETQHPPPPPRRRSPHRWIRWIVGTPRPSAPEHRTNASPHDGAGRHLDVRDALRALPASLDGSALPNGVVELLIEDFEAPTRQLFDIHDGRITLVEPGRHVPWTSISGSPTAWTRALSPTRDVSALRLTGDEQLARRVLAALPPPSPPPSP